MRLLLDTHVLLWLFKEPDRLSLTTHDRLAEPETEILVSVATLWEIAIKRAVGKLNLPGDLVQIVPRFVARNAVRQVQDATELERALAELLASPELRAQLGSRARAVIAENQGGIEKTVEMIVASIEN